MIYNKSNELSYQSIKKSIESLVREKQILILLWHGKDAPSSHTHSQHNIRFFSVDYTLLWIKVLKVGELFVFLPILVRYVPCGSLCVMDDDHDSIFAKSLPCYHHHRHRFHRPADHMIIHRYGQHRIRLVILNSNELWNGSSIVVYIQSDRCRNSTYLRWDHQLTILNHVLYKTGMSTPTKVSTHVTVVTHAVHTHNLMVEMSMMMAQGEKGNVVRLRCSCS
jgi:hypothetical protein